MDMSKACLAPIQPSINEADRKHPMFAEYQSYRSAMIRLMVEACSFQAWLMDKEREYRDNELRRHPQFKAFQAWMIETKGGTPGKTKLTWPANFYAWVNGERW